MKQNEVKNKIDVQAYINGAQLTSISQEFTTSMSLEELKEHMMDVCRAIDKIKRLQREQHSIKGLYNV